MNEFSFRETSLISKLKFNFFLIVFRKLNKTLLRPLFQSDLMRALSWLSLFPKSKL